ncbi:Secreted repeat [compost metagenome]
MNRSLLLAAGCAGLLLALPLVAVGDDDPAMIVSGKLVDHQGMTLYTFDKDDIGKSNCNGQCAANWPPLAASAGAEGNEDWTVVTRDDGSLQWAYYGRPLYTFVQDKQPGDTTGDGKMDVWHIAKPQ